ncbi:hypothetical protein [Paenarthrobacter nitroguajacolicus]|uniref:hypothetical protein n=1 Tax=Paenarthrobacter nitroguajacolicus TaxID=211146 RepID=UPI00248C5CD7|nr:hypothetical protein [Paenarthrobacter nitroguajacolicus]MDI2035738.1 hypothetical protein [Paenarthrobacter nitroguajacolicus]
MSKSLADEAAGHVVHFVDRLDASGSAPESLKLPKHLGALGRLVFAAVNVLAMAVVAGALYLIWTGETPGLWFNLLFTVILGAIPVVLWAILVGSVAEARSDLQLQAVWEQARERAQAVRGTVAARDIRLAEEGSVSSFELAVALEDGSTVSGRWRPAKSSSRLPLQPQVPGVGSEVIVWRVAEAGGASHPLVIQVIDPTVVQPRRTAS